MEMKNSARLWNNKEEQNLGNFWSSQMKGGVAETFCCFAVFQCFPLLLRHHLFACFYKIKRKRSGNDPESLIYDLCFAKLGQIVQICFSFSLCRQLSNSFPLSNTLSKVADSVKLIKPFPPSSFP